MFRIIALIFALLCLFLFGPWGFLLSPLILFLLLDWHSSDFIVLIVSFIGGFLYIFFMLFYYDRYIAFLTKHKISLSIFVSYLGLITGALCTLTYAKDHWWMFFTYLLFSASQLLTIISWSIIEDSKKPILYGMELVNLLISILISLFPFYLRFGDINIQIGSFLFLSYYKYEGGILVSILCLLTFLILLGLFVSIIYRVWNKKNYKSEIKKENRKLVIYGISLSLLINFLIIFFTIIIIKLIH